METWWIGPAIGATGLIAGWIRGRRADARLAAIENALTRRAIEAPEEVVRELPPEVGADATNQSLREALAEGISSLPEREKLIVTLYYYEGLTLREIGEVLGLSASRISQLHTKAILRLKSSLSDS